MSPIVRIDMSGRTSVLLEPQGQAFTLSTSPDGRHLAYVVMTCDPNVRLLENS